MWNQEFTPEKEVDGSGTSFAKQLGYDERGTNFVRFYYDNNGNDKFDTGEPQITSKEFESVQVQTKTFKVDASQYIGAFVDVNGAPLPNAQITALLEPRFDASEVLLRRKDSANDYRAAVKIEIEFVGLFDPATDPARPDRVANDNLLTHAQRDMHYASQGTTGVHITFLNDAGRSPTNGNVLRGRRQGDGIVIDWNGTAGVDETLVHEIGHLFGLGHAGTANHIMKEGALRNVGAANLLTKDEADTFLNGTVPE